MYVRLSLPSFHLTALPPMACPAQLSPQRALAAHLCRRPLLRTPAVQALGGAKAAHWVVFCTY